MRPAYKQRESFRIENESFFSLGAEIRTRSLKLFEQVSIHGLRKILVNDHYILKIMWTIFLLASLGSATYLVLQILLGFLQYKVVSFTRINYVDKINLPTVMICNMNPFATDYAKSEILNVKVFANNNIFNLVSTNGSSKLNYMNAKYYNSVYALTQLNESVRNGFGKPILVSCTLNRQDCQLDQFENYYDILFGNCLKFNVKRTNSFASSGAIDGLRLELFSDRASLNNSLLSIEEGFKVYVSDPSSINSFYADGLSAPFGFSTSFIMSKLSVKKQPYPFSECIHDLTKMDSYPSECYKKTLRFNNNQYSRILCQTMCYQINLISACGMYIFF